ncbi:reverse transcriptase domain-containing protein [Tanacetum coccineum]
MNTSTSNRSSKRSADWFRNEMKQPAKKWMRTYPPLRLEGLPFELERDLLQIISRNLRIVSSGVKPSSRWLRVWEFATRRPTPFVIRSSMKLGQRPKKGRIAKWAIKLGEHDIEFKGRNSFKGKILADFLAETPYGEDNDTKIKKPKTACEEPKLEDMWKLYTDGVSSFDGSGSSLMLVSPEGTEYTYTLRFEFETTNNEAEYEALLAGLRIAANMKIKDLSIFVDFHLVANQLQNGTCSKRPEQKSNALSKLASMTFSRLDKQVLVEVLAEKSIIQKEVADIIKEEDWVSPKSSSLIIGNSLPKTRHIPVLYLSLSSSSKRTGRGHKQRYRQGNRETPFSLTYGSDAVVPIEISVETRRIKEFEVIKNDKRRRQDLDILEERREIAFFREAHYKQKMESASKAEFQRKIDVVRKTYGDGAYKLETFSGSLVD